jgi:putative lipoic acid-binding regulatory protein
VVEAPSPLTFPTDYPLKVLGRPGDAFRARVHAIVLRYVPGTDAGQVSERLSANGNFLSISYLVRADSRAQIEALVGDLRACDGVLLLL